MKEFKIGEAWFRKDGNYGEKATITVILGLDDESKTCVTQDKGGGDYRVVPIHYLVSKVPDFPPKSHGVLWYAFWLGVACIGVVLAVPTVAKLGNRLSELLVP